MKIRDLIIIGAGPAGVTAGIYAKNFGMDFLTIGEEAGGLVNTAYKVENYPGIFNVSGKDLIRKFKAHQKHLRFTTKKERIRIIKKQGKIFEVHSDKAEYRAKAIILALGTEAKKLNIKNIDKLESRGVYYRGDDSKLLYNNKIVAVVGGANAAVMSAAMLAKRAKKVYLIYRKGQLRADALWVDKVKRLKNVDIVYSANIVELNGKGKLEQAILDNGKIIKISCLLIEAGCVPNSYLINNLGVKTNKNGYIKVKDDQSTNIPGVWAAGDATTGSNEFRQIVTACSEGAIAVLGAFNYLKNK